VCATGRRAVHGTAPSWGAYDGPAGVREDQGGAAVGVPGLPVLGLFETSAVGVEEP
jgi:hypothetical protein